MAFGLSRSVTMFSGLGWFFEEAASCKCPPQSVLGILYMIEVWRSVCAFFKVIEFCVVIRFDACPDHQASTVIRVDFSDIAKQAMGPWFSPYESTTRIPG
ncbi:hypothetical protein TNCV_2224651 [Trichonephila clavipes]|nr:hypothetical protein TNCV_2224651 [Trichonephila clavipes]